MDSHESSLKSYFLVFFALMALTALTVWVAFMDLGMMNNVVAMGIATIKGLMVMIVFMHLRHSPPLTILAIVVGIFWFAVLILITMSDMWTRGLLGFPGK